jgi:hypothetical protein
MGFYELRDIGLKNGDWHPYSGVGFFLMPREGGHLQAPLPALLPGGHRHAHQRLGHFPLQHRMPQTGYDCLEVLQNYIPGLKMPTSPRFCTEVRLREGPRIVGDYILTRDDVEAAAEFPDSIGKSSFKAGGYHVASVDTLNHVAATGHLRA